MVGQDNDAQIEILEKEVQDRVKLRPQFRFLRTVPGIGPILALTIMLETGEIERFASVGNYASYCRCVGSKKISNGKKKGQGRPRREPQKGWTPVKGEPGDL